MTSFLSFVAMGKNAEAVGVNSCVVGALLMFVPIVNIVCWVKIRGAIREKHGIEVRLLNF